jgi:MoaA/NifB/PqqE/SkfB family radical SAM enzyme
MRDVAINPHTFFVDVVDACNLKCRGCPRAQVGPSSGKRMELPTLKEMVDKGINDYNLISVCLYNWTEPFLHPELPQFIELLQAKNIHCSISTNLSFNRQTMIEEVIRRAPQNFIISVSGFTQTTYEKYHARGNIESVKENIELIGRLLTEYDLHDKIDVEVQYLVFKDNEDEVHLMREHCERNHVRCTTKPASPAEGVDNEDNNRRLLYSKIPETIDFDPPEARHWPCHQVFDALSVNFDGNVYLCCWYWYFEKYLVGNIFTTPSHEIFRRKLTHPRCGYCLGERRQPEAADFLRLRELISVGKQS